MTLDGLISPSIIITHYYVEATGHHGISTQSDFDVQLNIDYIVIDLQILYALLLSHGPQRYLFIDMVDTIPMLIVGTNLLKKTTLSLNLCTNLYLTKVRMDCLDRKWNVVSLHRYCQFIPVVILRHINMHYSIDRIH